MKRLAKIFGPIALVLLALVGIGVLLPAEWSASANRVVAVSPDSLYSALVRPASWNAWMPFPESGIEARGPASGEGAGFSWDDSVYGEGSFEIVGTAPRRSVAYRVSVDDGSIVVTGTVELDASGEGTEVRWTESGEAGRNPILGYQALFMEEQQGDQLRQVLDRLAAQMEGAAGEGS